LFAQHSHSRLQCHARVDRFGPEPEIASSDEYCEDKKGRQAYYHYGRYTVM
jgi:hypothetical protein